MALVAWLSTTPGVNGSGTPGRATIGVGDGTLELGTAGHLGIGGSVVNLT